jgi:uncharacterized protein YeaO (DUF488 family)
MIRTKRWDDPREETDGFRLLVCRYRPRALPKAKETWDAWWKQLGPSKDLHAAIYGKHGEPIEWDEFVQRYHDEMTRDPVAQEKITELARRVVAGETLTLLCSSSCTDETRCHRTLLKRLIEERAAGLTGSPGA